MSAANRIPQLERPSFFDGQQLTAQDLADAQAFNRELRWLHNRGLHDWGIAFGYGVSGKKGDRSVKVQPGYALDTGGKEIILGSAQEIPIPAVAGNSSGQAAAFFLTASYAEDSELSAESRTGPCNSGGAVKLGEAAGVRWQRQDGSGGDDAYRHGLDIILAVVSIQNCKLAADIDDTGRRSAVPVSQPYIVAGNTSEGNTDWEVWRDSANGPVLGIKTTVTTADAGFQTAPRYQANVVGARITDNNVVIDGYAEIANATANSFDLQMSLPQGFASGNSRTTTVNQESFDQVINDVIDKLISQLQAQGITVPGIDAAEIHDLLVHTNGSRLYVGQTLTLGTPVGFPTLLSTTYKLVPDDFANALDRFASRNGTTREALLAANMMSMNNASLTLGGALIIPGDPIPMNPASILTAAYMENFKSKLKWYVVWMGVEG